MVVYQETTYLNSKRNEMFKACSGIFKKNPSGTNINSFLIWNDESSFELESNKSRKNVWSKVCDAFKHTLVTSTLKHETDSIIEWGRSNNERFGNLTITDGKVTGAKYAQICEQNPLFYLRTVEENLNVCLLTE